MNIELKRWMKLLSNQLLVLYKNGVDGTRISIWDNYNGDYLETTFHRKNNNVVEIELKVWRDDEVINTAKFELFLPSDTTVTEFFTVKYLYDKVTTNMFVYNLLKSVFVISLKVMVSNTYTDEFDKIYEGIRLNKTTISTIQLHNKSGDGKALFVEMVYNVVTGRFDTNAYYNKNRLDLNVNIDAKQVCFNGLNLSEHISSFIDTAIKLIHVNEPDVSFF